MKKCIAIFLCICTLSVTALAAYDESLSAYDEYVLLYGEPPAIDDFATSDEYHTAYDAWQSGLEAYATQRALYFDGLAAERVAEEKAAEEEAVRIAAEKEAAEKAVEEQAPTTPPETVESAGSNYDVSSNYVDSSMDTSPVNQYPDRVRVDLAGNIWSLDGELLSPGTTPAYAPASGPDEDGMLLSDELADPDNLSTVADLDPPAVMANSGDSDGMPVWYIDDLRPTDISSEVLTGLKSMVTSIFGEYTPVTTTSVISETVGDDVHQYLVETVAPGAAGVDYEWVAGVLLFAIMLYCLMKLLGGVLK